MFIDRAVRRKVGDPETERLSVCVVSAEVSPGELVAILGRAVARFYEEWDRDAPHHSIDGPLPPPVVALGSTPPDAIVSIDKSSEWPITFDRLMTVLLGGTAGWYTG